MAGRTLAGGLALKGDWALGEDGWKDENDVNLLKLSVLAGRKVLDRVSATPGAPAEGDIYIFKSDHPTQANNVAVYDEGAWTYLAPFEGLKLYSVADAKEYGYTTAGGWVSAFETIQDMIATFLAAGSNVTLTYNDAGDQLTIASTASTTEQIQDMIATFLQAGTGISFSYNDAGDQFTITNTAPAAGTYTDENARDAIGSALVAGTSITITVDDAGDTITIAVSPAAISAVAGATYTLAASDAQKYLRATNAAGCDITVPKNTTVAIPVGFECTIRTVASAATKFTPEAGVTLNKVGGGTGTQTFAEVGATAQIKKVATDEWDIIGAMA